VNTSFSQESDNRFNHQLVFSLTGGATTQGGLEYQFGNMYGLKYTVRNPEKRVRLSIGFAINNYRAKTEKKYNSYNPQSDTFDILHWNNVLYECEILMDFILRENERNKLYLSLGWNVGSYVERKKVTKRYDESQNDKLISENAKVLGEPIESIFFGRGFGVGYERKINDLWSFTIIPNVKYKAGVDAVNPDVFDILTPELFLFGGLSAGIRLNL
jgi:hypothetical protein